MIIVEFEIEYLSKEERQTHIDLLIPCLERGGNSTNHKGVLAQYLNSNIPKGIPFLLCHACNNSKCSNPKHLYWGSPKDNVQDALIAGTFYRGGSAKGRKLSQEHKDAISRGLKRKPSNNPSGKKIYMPLV